MRNATRIGLLAVVLVFVTWSGCNSDNNRSGSQQTIVGSGVVAEEDRAVIGFTRLTLAAVGDVHITQGAVEGLRIQAEDNLLQYIRTTVRGGTLEITSDSGVTLQNTLPIEFHVSLISLDGLLLAGVGEFDGPDLTVDQLSLTHSGVGSFDLVNLDAVGLDIVLSGVGDISISGTVGVQDITLSGVGDYEAENLASTEADIVVSGLGSVTVRVSDRLDVTISSTGSVFYYGDPILTISGSGTGTVQRLGP
jgi:hypothetical protein